MDSQKAWIACGLMLSGLVFVSGCAERSSSSATSSSTTASSPSVVTAPSSVSTPNTEEHGHKPGAHGGVLISLGRDSYHAEAVFEKGGVLRLYTLGKEESRVIDVEKQTLKGFVKSEGDAEAQQFTLTPEPQDGDTEGRTSQFVGALPKGLWGQNLEVTVPNIVISGERFRLGFKSTSQEHDEGMPNKAHADEEQTLYLTPGGLYTEADIKANGSTTAAAKFKGQKASHNVKPDPGDKICPISMTKANPKFTWIIGGMPYQFCCPPCVDEFVKLAKEHPEEVKTPDTYIK